MHLGRESSKIVSIQTHSWAISSHDPCFIIIIFIHFGCFQLTQDVKHQLFRQQQIDAQQAQLRAQARSARHCKTLRVHGHDLCTVLEYLERCFAALVPFLVCSSFFTCCFAHAGSAGTPGPTSCSKPCSSSGTSCTAGPTAGGRARKGLVTWRRASLGSDIFCMLGGVRRKERSKLKFLSDFLGKEISESLSTSCDIHVREFARETRKPRN